MEWITVGQLAKQAGVSVRTLQHYDRIGLLKPSNMSEGGRRLYSINDLTVLHQIITLKNLGLPLESIKQRLLPVESNDDIKNMLIKQSQVINEQISKAGKVMESIQMLIREINEQNKIDWPKYANMVKLIQENNESFWMVNYLEQDMLEEIKQIHEHYTESELPSDWLVRYMKKVMDLIDQGVKPNSVEGQRLALELWNILEKYTGGQTEKMHRLYDFFSDSGSWPKQYSDMQEVTRNYIESMIEYYITVNKIMPFNE